MHIAQKKNEKCTLRMDARKTKSKQKGEKLLNHKFTYTQQAAKSFLI